MLKFLRYFIPLFILAIGGFLSYVLIITKPAPRQRNFPVRTPEVQVINPAIQSYQVSLKSQGIVQARTQINLNAEIRGRIIEIAPTFREGAFFESGDILLKIDALDYESDLVVSEAALAQAELLLAQEEARYEQAKLDWNRLGIDEDATGLALREPQIKQARANIASAKARVASAKRNLERTIVRAPFAGRILKKNVDIGQFVNAGMALASIYAVDFAEVRLPLNDKQLSVLDLRKTYRGDEPDLKNGPSVSLTYLEGGARYSWKGRIVRAEGAVDFNSRQLFVIAQVKNPYGKTDEGKPPLKVGGFVEARIQGKKLDDVVVFPRPLLKETSYVNVVDQDQVLRRRKMKIVWMSDNDIVVRKDSFLQGDRLCLTQVPYSLDGLEVHVEEVQAFQQKENVKTESVPQKKRSSSVGKGGFLQMILGSIPPEKTVPAEIKRQLNEAMSSGNREEIKPAMEALKKWAESEGIELPVGRGGK